MTKQYKKLLLLLLIISLGISTIINPQKVSADTKRHLMLAPDFITLTKVGSKDEENLSATDELREALEGAEFQILNSKGKPIRFAKMNKDALPKTLVELLSKESDSEEQKNQFKILEEKGNINYYQQELITKKFWDKGYIKESVYELQKNALYPGGIPDESEYKDTVITTKDSPLILGLFPENPNSVKYIIGNTEVLKELVPSEWQDFLGYDNEPEYILLFFMNFSEEMTIKETKAPEGYDIIDPITFETEAYIVGWNKIEPLDNSNDVEKKFLEDIKGFGDANPKRLLENYTLNENLSDEDVNKIEEILNDELGDITQNLISNSTPKIINHTLEDPKKTKEIPYIDVLVEKKWITNDESNLEPITVNLYKNSNITAERIVLNKENGWKSKFENLPLEDDDNSNQNIYSIREEGELDGKIKINEKWFNVSYDGNMEDGYTITNNEDEPWIPIISPTTEPTTPTEPKSPAETMGPTSLSEPTKLIISTEPTNSTGPALLPKTGDKSGSYLWLSIMCMSVGASLLLFRRKNTK